MIFNMSSQVFLSVIVCTYKRPEILGKCLSALQKQDVAADEYEVMVVDNDPGQSAYPVILPYLKAHSKFRYFCEENIGISHARNRGLQESRGSFLAYVDDDALACVSWCRRILAAFQSVQPVPSAVGGPIYPWIDREVPVWFSESLEVRTWGVKACFLQKNLAKVGFSGSNMAFPKSVLESIGGFDPSFGLKGAVLRMGEDTELFSRLYSRSPNFWYDPKIVVNHYVSEKALSIKSRVLRWYQNGFCRGRLERESRAGLLTLIHFLKVPAFFFVFAPWRLCVRSSRKTELVRVLQDLAFLAGRASGSLRR